MTDWLPFFAVLLVGVCAVAGLYWCWPWFHRTLERIWLGRGYQPNRSWSDGEARPKVVSQKRTRLELVRKIQGKQ